MDQEFDRLDDLARRLMAGGDEGFWVLSTGERIYVALASSRVDLLRLDHFTVVGALNRLGETWTQALLQRWKYR